MSEIIIGLVAIVAIAFIFETVKRTSGARHSGGGDGDEYISADEAGPTQSGRFRAQRVKAAIQKARQDTHSEKGAKKKPDASAHQSLAHQQVDEEGGQKDLPDPFQVDYHEDD